MVTKWIAAPLIVLAVAAAADAQTPARAAPAAPAGQAEGVEPIRCWWRTSAAAVRVGEPFDVVLTCSVVETERLTVVPSQGELEPTAMQLQPFEVMSGSQAPDLHSADHRFFQYDYRLRLIADDQFGKDVKLPELKIAYKIRSRTDNEVSEGRDQQYVMPPLSVRILSLVPADAVDIRDSSIETFQEIERQSSRANILRAVGGILMGFGALAVVIGLVRLASGARKAATAPRSLATDGAILREIGRELSAIRRARSEGSWTPALTGRLLTAFRILSGYVLGVPARPVPADHRATPNGTSGDFTVRGRGLRSARVVVPAWVTPQVVAEERGRYTNGNGGSRAGVLEQLEGTLARLTAAQYGRDTALDEAALDEMLDTGQGMLRRVRIQNVWVVKKAFAFARPKAAAESREWSR
jgi:hypothetical protein